MQAGTFDDRADRWLAWDTFDLDRRGWAEMTTALAAVYAEIGQIRKDAAARLSEGAEAAIPITFAELAFESPPAPPTPLG